MHKIKSVCVFYKRLFYLLFIRKRIPDKSHNSVKDRRRRKTSDEIFQFPYWACLDFMFVGWGVGEQTVACN